MSEKEDLSRVGFVAMTPVEECVMGSMFCVNCWPKEKTYAHFVWFGLSLCAKCFEQRRKDVDLMGGHEICPGIDKRGRENFKSVWGEEPPKDYSL